MVSPLLLLILDLLLEEDGVLQEVRGVGHPPGGLALARPHHAQPILRLHVRRTQLSPVKENVCQVLDILYVASSVFKFLALAISITVGTISL